MRPVIPLMVKAVPDEDARLVRAACYHGNECFTSWRHADALVDFFRPRGLKMTNECQGFVDQYGYWWSRWRSARIALRSGQLLSIPSILTSEELWDKDGKPRVPGEPWDPMS